MPERPAPGWRDLTLDLCGCAAIAGPEPVSAALLACPGIEQVHVDPYLTWALATFDPARASPAEIVAHLATAGFEVRVAHLFDPQELP